MCLRDPQSSQIWAKLDAEIPLPERNAWDMSRLSKLIHV